MSSSSSINHVRRGGGEPLLLIHGLGGAWRSWDPVIDALAAQREVIALDLPGFGESTPLPDEPSTAALADSIEGFLDANDLDGVDVAGSSLGATLALELARRRRVGATVALDPGGFWNDRELAVFSASSRASYPLIKALQPVMPQLTGNAVARTLLFAQLSARPWALSGDLLLNEMRSYAGAPSFEPALKALIEGPRQPGMPAGAARGPIVIGWGRSDRLTFPRQAARALARFPDASIHWFERCGHFPQWDRPEETVRVILGTTAEDRGERPGP